MWSAVGMVSEYGAGLRLPFFATASLRIAVLPSWNQTNGLPPLPRQCEVRPVGQSVGQSAGMCAQSVNWVGGIVNITPRFVAWTMDEWMDGRGSTGKYIYMPIVEELDLFRLWYKQAHQVQRTHLSTNRAE